MITREFVQNLVADSKEVRFTYNGLPHFGMIIDSNLNSNYVEPFGTVTISIFQENDEEEICTNVANVKLIRVY